MNDTSWCFCVVQTSASYLPCFTVLAQVQVPCHVGVSRWLLVNSKNGPSVANAADDDEESVVCTYPDCWSPPRDHMPQVCGHCSSVHQKRAQTQSLAPKVPSVQSSSCRNTSGSSLLNVLGPVSPGHQGTRRHGTGSCSQPACVPSTLVISPCDGGAYWGAQATCMRGGSCADLRGRDQQAGLMDQGTLMPLFLLGFWAWFLGWGSFLGTR